MCDSSIHAEVVNKVMNERSKNLEMETQHDGRRAGSEEIIFSSHHKHLPQRHLTVAELRSVHVAHSATPYIFFEDSCTYIKSASHTSTRVGVPSIESAPVEQSSISSFT